MTTLPLSQALPVEARTEHPHVTRVEGVPTVRDTRLAVRLIAQMYRAGDTVDDIVRSFPHISAAAVYDAISYYLDHRAEMEEEIAANRVEYVVKQLGGQINERGIVTFPK